MGDKPRSKAKSSAPKENTAAVSSDSLGSLANISHDRGRGNVRVKLSKRAVVTHLVCVC
jgi:hypothetical protein